MGESGVSLQTLLAALALALALAAVVIHHHHSEYSYSYSAEVDTRTPKLSSTAPLCCAVLCMLIETNAMTSTDSLTDRRRDFLLFLFFVSYGCKRSGELS